MSKLKKINYLSCLLFICLISILSCDQKDVPEGTKSFGIFKVLDDEKTVEMDGEIGDKTLTNFNTMLSRFPNIDKINMKEVPGSFNDDVNLEVSLLVNQSNIATHLMDNGLIASGGVDFFLAGTMRTQGSDTKIGVHSWSDGSADATDFPVGHANHLPYINYYKKVGFTQAEAEAFYYFTINTAGADDIYYMTAAEISQYKILTP